MCLAIATLAAPDDISYWVDLSGLTGKQLERIAETLRVADRRVLSGAEQRLLAWWRSEGAPIDRALKTLLEVWLGSQNEQKAADTPNHQLGEAQAEVPKRYSTPAPPGATTARDLVPMDELMQVLNDLFRRYLGERGTGPAAVVSIDDDPAKRIEAVIQALEDATASVLRAQSGAGETEYPARSGSLD